MNKELDEINADDVEYDTESFVKSLLTEIKRDK